MKSLVLGIIACALLCVGCKSWGKFWEVTLCDEKVGYAAMSSRVNAARFLEILTIERDKGSFRGASNVAIIDPKSNGSFCSAAAQSAYLNKM